MFEFALPFSDVFRNYEIEQDCFYRIEKDEDEQVFFWPVNETSGTKESVSVEQETTYE